MRTAMIVGFAVLVLGLTGCWGTTGGSEKKPLLSYNMTQSLSRSAGDIAMTEALDKGVDKAKAREFVDAIINLIVRGEISKNILQTSANALAVKYGIPSAYVSALVAVVPNDVGVDELIPDKWKTPLLSFLRDGAIRAADLYKDQTPVK